MIRQLCIPRRTPSLAAVLLLAVACGGEATPPGDQPAGSSSRGRPDILLISIDTLRADRVGAYGAAAARTPVIDRLASRGALFQSAFSPVPITLPAHASLLSGLNPPTHTVRDNGSFRLPEEVVTLSERLREGGWATAAFIGGLPLMRAGGLDQGFDLYDDAIAVRRLDSAGRATRPERRADEVLDLARRWLLQQPDDRPAFALIHLYDPHSPYEQPLPGAMTPSYEGEIAYVDAALGRFFDALGADGRWGRALTIVTADHGEGLGEHGEQTHCIFVYDSTLRVPLIVHWPGVVEPRSIAGSVGLIDVTPTLLDLLALPPLSGAEGVSLAETLRRGAAAPPRELYFESLFGELRFGWAPLRGLREDGLKYIAAPRPELYDVERDPRELEDRWSADSVAAADLAARLLEIGTGGATRVRLDPEAARALASLGYVSAPPAPGAAEGQAPDPKDQIHVYEGFQLAHEEFLGGRAAEALTRMEDLEPALRRSPYFYLEWGNMAAGAERWSLAADAYVKSLTLDGTQADALLNLGVARMKLGKFPDAAKQFEALLLAHPDHATGHLYLGVVQAKHLGDTTAARHHFERFVQLAPDHPEAAQIRRALAAAPAGTSRP